jgi:hypothetical protein
MNCPSHAVMLQIAVLLSAGSTLALTASGKDLVREIHLRITRTPCLSSIRVSWEKSEVRRVWGACDTGATSTGASITYVRYADKLLYTLPIVPRLSNSQLPTLTLRLLQHTMPNFSRKLLDKTRSALHIDRPGQPLSTTESVVAQAHLQSMPRVTISGNTFREPPC